MKQACIIETKPIKRGDFFWYALVDVAASAGETPLYRAPAHHQRGNPSRVDPEEQRQALANLTDWSEENGWDVVV